MFVYMFYPKGAFELFVYGMTEVGKVRKGS